MRKGKSLIARLIFNRFAGEAIALEIWSTGQYDYHKHQILKDEAMLKRVHAWVVERKLPMQFDNETGYFVEFVPEAI